ncbi:aldolase catalytic domain-containing protein [Paraglaciecola chathamensis]|uniref:4-hydroxy 2-oxovalerate aldolase n=1 Tax=Paraglaciecola chathamensis S18K6 TaxID=1127672 RepID=A0AAV3V0T4_9ALTE|nr:aldolase catalytic domain-containing protein [Paraglaciecola chathamensis]GAC10547.1 4-hydroxy 2-oxovalerate aldolase [Paraglaciecola chathamensis S18K6]
MKDNLALLDCTLRDGGYYNQWDFQEEIVENYLHSIAESGIEYVELGLRNFSKEGFLGAYAYTTELHLNSIELPIGPKYGVMVDAKTILTSSLSVTSAIDELFIPAENSKLSFVRVAAHFDEVEQCGPFVKHLKNLGYIVGFNLMQSGGKSSALITEKAKEIWAWSCVDVLYFADSLGNMNSNEVARIVAALREGWNSLLGIHTHNNMGKGLDNTLAAMDLGVNWVDCTVTGMGRGAGNTQTEILLAVLDTVEKKYKPKAIYKLVIHYFEKMQKQYGWGSNLLYFLGAQNEVHPTYIQNLLSNTHFGSSEVVGAIDYLNTIEGTSSYNGEILNAALNFNNSSAEVLGSLDMISLFEGREILVLTNGPSTKRYKNAIEIYIRQKKPIVIAINLVDGVSPELIDYHVISHNTKYLSDSERYKNLRGSLILPKHRFSTDELASLKSLKLFDYGLSVEDKVFSIEEKFVTIPHDVTVGYILGALNTGNAKNIGFVGLDGYGMGDIRQQEMVNIFTLYSQIKNACPIKSLTPTTYPIVRSSIYDTN